MKMVCSAWRICDQPCSDKYPHEQGSRCDGECESQYHGRCEPVAPSSDIAKPPLTGAELIAQERERQMSVEGWDARHDTGHLKAELTQAAICYAADVAAKYETPKWRDELRSLAIHFWPWDKQWWKPTPDDAIRQLTKAGALIAAEIDRLQRLGGSPDTPPPSEAIKP